MSSTVREAKRVVLCDDHEIVREAIKARMANSSTVEIVGEAGNGRDVVDVVKELEPDVLIIDVELPKRDGIEATKEVLRARPRTKVIIFTAHAQPDLLALALRAGASGYVLKSAPSEAFRRERMGCRSQEDSSLPDCWNSGIPAGQFGRRRRALSSTRRAPG